MNIKSLVCSVSVLVGLASTLVACGGDAVEGSWESDAKFAGHRHEFSVQQDGDAIVGDGSFYLLANDGSYVKCGGRIDAKIVREGKYDVTLKFTGDQGCSEVPAVDFQCELQRSDEELDCGSDGGLFNRVQ